MMEEIDALVIGAGPAGLMAAEVMARAGRQVMICEAKPSPARKFLMAGKSGLNLTKDEPLEEYLAAFRAPWLAPHLAAFGPGAVMDWARGLGQEAFTGSSGRVFPKAMKGSPLLRAWLGRLDDLGVRLERGWRWQGWQGEDLLFATPRGTALLHARRVVLALGGASWARLGSDGAWVGDLAARGVAIAPWQPANMGFGVAWTPHMARHFGQPIKGAHLRAGTEESSGEFVISARGIEGGGIYALSRALREGARLEIDLLPRLSADGLAQKLSHLRAGESRANQLRKLGLSPAAAALAMEALPKGAPLAGLKTFTLPLTGPHPLDEAISVAGGIRAESLGADLSIKGLPGYFACGEMLDWEAPTGGYLLSGCLATGRAAGLAALV